MYRYDELSRDQLERVANLLLDVCLNYVEVNYIEFLLHSNGLGDAELKAIGFDEDRERGEIGIEVR